MDVVQLAMLTAVGQYKDVTADTLVLELYGYQVTTACFISTSHLVGQDYQNRFIHIPKHGRNDFIGILFTEKGYAPMVDVALEHLFYANARGLVRVIDGREGFAIPEKEFLIPTLGLDVEMNMTFAQYNIRQNHSAHIYEKVDQWMDWLELESTVAGYAH